MVLGVRGLIRKFLFLYFLIKIETENNFFQNVEFSACALERMNYNKLFVPKKKPSIFLAIFTNTFMRKRNEKFCLMKALRMVFPTTMLALQPFTSN
jgi:hypothetical protein